MYGLEKHHIVFRSQGGLDFPDNFAYLTAEQHRGNDGPHRNKKRDLQLKIDMQVKIENKLSKDYYTIEELTETLELSRKQAEKICKKFNLHKEGYPKQDIVRRLMGGRLY